MPAASPAPSPAAKKPVGSGAREAGSAPPPRPPPALPLPKPVPAASRVHTEYLNDAGIEVGWNAPAEQGVRYLRRVEGSGWEFGLGAAFGTYWGPKLSLLARHQDDIERGFFEQASIGLMAGASGVKETVTSTEGKSTAATFKRTPGRTFDFLVGYRVDLRKTLLELLDSAYLDAFVGYSFNLQGTYFQTGSPLVQLDPSSRGSLSMQTPGGVIVGLSYGWLF